MNASDSSIGFIKGSTSFTAEHYAKYSLLSIVIICGTIGNITVIRMFGLTDRKHQAGSALVVTLAVTDLFSSIAIPVDVLTYITLKAKYPVFGGRGPYPYGEGACYFLSSVHSLFVTASAWLLAAISIERVRWVKTQFFLLSLNNYCYLMLVM